jgi:hypothetical protein
VWLKRGRTFVNEAHESVRSHLWVVISDPEQDPDRVVIVNLTTLRSGVDESCIVRRGEHGFVSRDSVVNYAESRITRAEDLERLVQGGQLSPSADASENLLRRITEGLDRSKRIARDRRSEILSILSKQGLVG